MSAVTQHNEQQEERRSRQQRLVGSLDIMDPPKLINRREDTEPVLSAAVAEQVWGPNTSFLFTQNMLETQILLRIT